MCTIVLVVQCTNMLGVRALWSRTFRTRRSDNSRCRSRLVELVSVRNSLCTIKHQFDLTVNGLREERISKCPFSIAV